MNKDKSLIEYFEFRSRKALDILIEQLKRARTASKRTKLAIRIEEWKERIKNLAPK